MWLETFRAKVAPIDKRFRFCHGFYIIRRNCSVCDNAPGTKFSVYRSVQQHRQKSKMKQMILEAGKSLVLTALI